MRSIAFVFLAVAMGPLAVCADDRFGSTGQVVPYGSISFSHSASTASDSSSSNTLEAGAGVLYFLSSNFAVGAQIASSYDSEPGNGYTDWQIGAAPVVALNFWLSDRVSFFPRLELILGYSSYQYDGQLPDGESFVATTTFVVRPLIAAPILFHPVPHFFVGLGPFGYVSLYTSSKYSTGYELGLSTTIGGYF